MVFLTDFMQFCREWFWEGFIWNHILFARPLQDTFF